VKQAIRILKKNTHNKMLLLSRGIFFALLIFCYEFSQAQSDFVGEIKSSFKTKPKLDLRFDTRNSFITSRLAQVRGLKLGIDYEGKVKLGLSYNWLHSEIKRERSVNDQLVQSKLHYAYLAPYFEYAFYRKGPWEISVPIHLGLGWANYNWSLQGLSESSPYRFILSYEPYMTCRYTVLRYFGLGAGVGYRLVLIGNSDLGENLNSPIYVFKVQVLLGKIWADLSSRKN
jgi:hypothetical protein